MHSANVELVRTITAAWARGDFSSADWADPAIEFVRPDGPAPGDWTGLSGLSEGTRALVEAWEDFRFTTDAIHELDAERVLVLNRVAARGRTSGIDVGQLETKGAGLFHVRDGKVVRLVHWFHRDRALAELGLPADLVDARG